MKILKHNLASFKRHGFKRHGFKRHHRHGLSVIEVLTSIVVALVGLAGVLAMIPFSIKQTQSGLDQDAATTMARNALSNFEASGYKIVSGLPPRLNWVASDDSSLETADEDDSRVTTAASNPLVCIDPLGITEQDGFSTFPFNSSVNFMETVTLARPDGAPFTVTDARRMFRLTDDIVFAESDDPNIEDSELNGPQQIFNESVNPADGSIIQLNRQSTGAVSWCAIAQPIINDPNAEEVDIYKFHVLVFKDRVTDSMVPESEMAAARVTSPTGLAQPLSTIEIDVPLNDTIRRNDWVMLHNQDPASGPEAFRTNITFARVSNLFSDGVTSTLTLDGPDFDFTTTPTTVVHLRDVVAVFPRTIKLETVSADWTIDGN